MGEWLTDCFWYDTQAAISHQEKEINASLGEEDTKSLDGGTHTERNDSQEEEETHGHEAGRFPRSNKRTKVSASGSWREGEQTWPDEKYDTVLKGGSGESYHSNSTSFSSSETMDMDRQGLYYDNQQNSENHQIFSKKHPPTTKTTPTTSFSNETNSISPTSTSFTIYEDPADDARTEETYSFHHLSFFLPESWRSCPGDNKENADDNYYDEDEETIIDDFQFFEGSEDMDHRQLFQRQHQSQSQNHIVNVDMNADQPDEAASDLLSVNTGLRNMDLGGRTREQQTILSSREFANPDTEAIDINPSTNDSTSTAENQPRYHSPPETQHEEGILNPSAIERLASMTWLGAPPRRFLGRGRSRGSGHGLGRRRLQRSLGV